MFDWCQNYNLPRMIMSIDFEKAFDSVSLELILITLDIFKFGKNFKLWIKKFWEWRMVKTLMG